MGRVRGNSTARTTRPLTKWTCGSGPAPARSTGGAARLSAVGRRALQAVQLARALFFRAYRYFRRRTARDPPPPAFRNFSRIEVTHCGGSKFETNGAFFYAFRGTGLYIDIGRSLAFETHDDASRYLLGRPCAPGKPPDMKLGIFQCDAELPRIIGAAKSQGWDSLQFTRHCDAFCTGPSPEALQRARAQGRDPWTFTSMSDALSGRTRGRSARGFEVVLTRFAGTDACPAGLEFFRGWGGHERCACDARLRSQRGRCAACAPVAT